jgi:hypothetical protein
MAKKLYVGNLPWSVDDSALKETFSEAGTVETATVIKDKMSGRSKGFGFVEMATEEEAQKAVEMFSGKEMEGRPLTKPARWKSALAGMPAAAALEADENADRETGSLQKLPDSGSFCFRVCYN